MHFYVLVLFVAAASAKKLVSDDDVDTCACVFEEELKATMGMRSVQKKEISFSDLADIIAQNNKEVQMQLKENSNDIKQLAKCQKFWKWNDVPRSNFVNVSSIGMAFFIGTVHLNWDDAEAWCKQKGTSLATLKADYEINMVSTRLAVDQGYVSNLFWLSASDKNRVRGDFVWPDGTPVDANKWANEYPKAFKENEYKTTAVLLSTMAVGTLQDRKSDNLNMFLCQVPPDLKNCFETY